jgi:hypothetical protein
VTNHPNRNRTARAERIVDVVLADFGQAVIRISMRDAMVAACAAALIDREGRTPCLSALASGEACQPDARLKRCTICGFIVDPKFTADKPTVRMRP